VDKETFIKTYIDIETNTFIRKEKFTKLNELVQYLRNNGTEFDADEIIEIAKTFIEKGVTIRQPLFKYILYPSLSEQVEKDNLEAVKILVQLDQHLISYNGYKGNCKYTGVYLLRKGLEISSNDRELLEAYEGKTRNYIMYTLHELPAGVLFDMDGASIEQCDDLLAMTDEYESICHKLQINRSKLIKECRFYYTSYKSYLNAFSDYKNFSEYLHKCQK
jgi:hypothetical protein